MKALKWVLIVVGAVCLGFGLFMVIRMSMDLKTVMGAANAGRGADPFASPMPTVWIVAGISLAAGALLGLGIGLPRRTSGSVRKDALEGAAAQREQAIRENALRRASAGPSASHAGRDEPGELTAPARGADETPQLERGDQTSSSTDDDAAVQDEEKDG